MTTINRRALLRGIAAASVLAAPVAAASAQPIKEGLPAPAGRFAVQFVGDSMWPRIEDGETVVIDPSLPMRPTGLVYLKLRDGGAHIASLEAYLPSMRAPETLVVRTFNPDRLYPIGADEIEAVYRVAGVWSADNWHVV